MHGRKGRGSFARRRKISKRKKKGVGENHRKRSASKTKQKKKSLAKTRSERGEGGIDFFETSVTTVRKKNEKKRTKFRK